MTIGKRLAQPFNCTHIAMTSIANGRECELIDVYNDTVYYRMKSDEPGLFSCSKKNFDAWFKPVPKRLPKIGDVYTKNQGLRLFTVVLCANNLVVCSRADTHVGNYVYTYPLDVFEKEFTLTKENRDE